VVMCPHSVPERKSIQVKDAAGNCVIFPPALSLPAPPHPSGLLPHSHTLQGDPSEQCQVCLTASRSSGWMLWQSQCKEDSLLHAFLHCLSQSWSNCSPTMLSAKGKVSMTQRFQPLEASSQECGKVNARTSKHNCVEFN
jgi:hypothetical protein